MRRLADIRNLQVRMFKLKIPITQKIPHLTIRGC